MIAIPNIEKPKGCIDCPVNDMVCELWTEVTNIKAHKHKDCPLIEIGDLEYKAFKEFMAIFFSKLDDHILYGERSEE